MRINGLCALKRNKLMNIINPIVSDWPNLVLKYLNIFQVLLTQYCYPSFEQLTTAQLYKKPHVLGHLTTARLHKKPTFLAHLITAHLYNKPYLFAHLTTARLYKKPHVLGHLSTTQLYKKLHSSYGSYPHSICLISLLRAGKVQLPHLRTISLISFLILLPHLH